MKATILLKPYPDDNLNMRLFLFMVLPTKRYSIYSSNLIHDADMEEYKDELEGAINESTLLINAIPGLKLIVDQSVSEFIEGSEEEIRKFVSMLVTEM